MISVPNILRSSFWQYSEVKTQNTSLDFLLKTISESILICFFFLLLITTIGWCLNLGVKRLYFPLAIIFSLVYCYRNSKSYFCIITLLIIILGSIVLNSFIYDISCDSNLYHYPISILLSEGWNPLDTSTYHSIYQHDEIWVVHYAKFVEIIGSNIFVISKNINSIKSVNLIFFITTAFYVYYFLKSVLHTKHAFGVTLFAMCNPVIGSQLFTGYIDQYIYYYLPLSICLIIKIGKEKQITDIFFLSLITIFAIGTKFNAFFYQGLTLFSAILWFLLHKNWQSVRILFLVGLTSLIASVFLFWHPYITNWIVTDNPLYPLLGEGAVDILDSQTPSIFLGNNRFYNFLLSIFFTWINPHRYGLFVNYDQRICGFTLWFAPLLILSIILLISYWKKWNNLSKFIYLTTLLSCFIFAQSWWARYIPQFWLLPLIAIINAPNNFWRGTFLVLGLLTILMSGINNWKGTITITKNTNLLLESLRDKTIIPKYKPTEAHRCIFKAYNITYTNPDSLPTGPTSIDQCLPFWIKED